MKRALAAVAVLVVAAAVLQLSGALPSLSPFGVEEVDRSQPAVLRAVRELSQYHAAAGDYQVVIDIEQDVEWVPAVLAGKRTLFVAAGSVNAFVDFGGLADDALVLSADGKSVELRLPEAVLDEPNLDQDRSYVFSQERGLLNRLGAIIDVPDQQRFYVVAEERLATAARESGLTERADENTRAMLTRVLQALGFQVVFAEGA
ncbi:hypothetical protein GCM10018963_14890 [Saccharothrix longispora]